MLFEQENGDEDGDDADNCKQVRLQASHASTAASTRSTATVINELSLDDAIANLEETRKVADAMSKIQSNYHEAQQRMNSIDVTQLEVFVTVQTLNTCYNIVKGLLLEHDPEFDTENM